MGTRRFSIIIVSPDGTIAAALARFLAMRNFGVIGTASTIPKLLELMQPGRPDLVLLDQALQPAKAIISLAAELDRMGIGTVVLARPKFRHPDEPLQFNAAGLIRSLHAATKVAEPALAPA